MAVTFVDWRDMHRWKLINDALDLGRPEPEETYSTSEHLYTQLDIPREATGTLPRAMRERAGLEAEAIEDIGETGKIRTPRRGRGGQASGRASAGRGGTGGSTGRGGTGGSTGRGASQPRKTTLDAGDGAVPAGGDRSRRRRRTRGGRDLSRREPGGENQPEETRRKAS